MKHSLPTISCIRRLQLGSTRRTRPFTSRCASTLVKIDFTSFFSRNDHWASLTPKALVTPGLRRNSALTSDSNVASTSQSLEGYREMEALTPQHLIKIYTQLSKSRLTILNVLAAMSSVALSPLPTTVPMLLSTAIGTALCCASANTLNQLQEIPYDAQMTRTRMRPLVRGAITPLHAAAFATVTGMGGPALLWTMVNPTTAVLGWSAIALYAGPYTWLKRTHVANTWVGAVVGAIPPLMGWTACGGQLQPSLSYPPAYFLPSFLSPVSTTDIDLSLIDNPLSPLALFLLLFSWQFPHFMSFSYLVRASYAQAGYKMLSVLSPSHNALVSLRHATLLIPVCSVLMPLSGLVTWTFAITSLIPNLIYTRASWRFWRAGGEREARVVWHHSLWYLPVVLGLMMVHKQGMDWLKLIGIKGDDEQTSS